MLLHFNYTGIVVCYIGSAEKAGSHIRVDWIQNGNQPSHHRGQSDARRGDAGHRQRPLTSRPTRHPPRFPNPNSTSMTRTSRSRSGRETRPIRGRLGVPDAGGHARGIRHRPRRRLHLRAEEDDPRTDAANLPVRPPRAHLHPHLVPSLTSMKGPAYGYLG